MKKILLSLAAMAAFGIANAEEVTFTFNGGEAEVYGLTRTSDNSAEYYGEAPGTPMTEGAVTINLLKAPFGSYAGSGVRLWTDGLRIMKNAGFTISVAGGEVTNVSIATVKANGCNSLVIDGTPAEMTLDADNNKLGTWAGSAATVAFANDATKGLKGTLAITSITVTYTGGVVDTRKDAGLSFPESSYTVVLGDVFTAPELTKETNAAVTYASSADEVVAVNPNTGDVEILAAGTVTITATAEANDEYKAGSASYTLTVKSPNEILNADFSTNCGFTFEDGTLPEGVKYVWTRDSSYGYMKATSYVGGKTYAVDGAYLVSPELDLTEWTGITLTFSHVINFFASVDAAKADCSLHVREVGGTWGEAIAIPTWPAALGWKPWVESGEIDLNAYAGKKVQIGFKYTCNGEKAGTWEVDNVLMTGTRNSGVEAVEVADTEAPVEYYNLQGVRVANPEGGIFIRRQGASVSKVVIR